jgi:hypothetical protein
MSLLVDSGVINLNELVSDPSLIVENAEGIWITIIVVILVMYIAGLIYISGFIPFGKNINSRLMVIVSWIIIILSLLLLVSSVGFGWYVYSGLNNLDPQNPSSMDEVLSLYSFVQIGMNVLGVINLLIAFAILIFAVSLFNGRKVTWFVIPAGIGYILLSIYFVIFTLVVLLLLNHVISLMLSVVSGDLSALAGLFQPSDYLRTLSGIAKVLSNKIVVLIIQIISILAGLFGALTLLKGASVFGKNKKKLI